VILDELPYTLRLAGLGMAFIIVLGLFFGTVSALNVNSWLDSALMAIAVSGLSIPDFFLAMLLILLFSVKLGWFPIVGPESLKILVLPAFVIGFRASALISRMTRSGLLEVLGEDYIRTARAKGLSEQVVVIRHALKNTLIPVVTMLGLQFGGLLGGAVIVETVFARRGIGYLAVKAIEQRDYPMAQGTVLFVAVFYVLLNVIVDFIYAYIDPRIRYD
jgi:ABC-type dipeptide/oligopeptide/nickel transport system permease component